MFGTPYNGTKQAKAFMLKPKKRTMTAMVSKRRAVAECILLGYAPTKSFVNDRLGGLEHQPCSHDFPKPPTNPFS